MSKNVKIAVAVAIAFIGISALGFMLSQSGSELGKNSVLIPPVQAPVKTQAVEEDGGVLSLPEPTGKVDDTVKAAIDEASFEESLASQESDDVQSTLDDSEEINDFSQTYDENEF